MGNEYDYKGKRLVLQPVSRSEFEALKRFGDYAELHDGTLIRVEGNTEFRTARTLRSESEVRTIRIGLPDRCRNGRRFEPVCGFMGWCAQRC